MNARLVAGFIVCLVLVACRGAGAGASPSPAAPSAPTASIAASASSGEPTEVTVFAAASLKGALEAVVEAYRAVDADVTLVLSTDSSAALATQIEQGAPADLFLSADTKYPQTLADAGLTAGPPIVFAGNELTVIVPASDATQLETPADLARDGVQVVAAGEAVPITRYATELVANLAAEAGYPGDFEAAYARNIVSREDNVKAVVAKIELGEGDAAIVYVTDARASDMVATLTVPPSANVPASYAGVVVAASGHAAAAQDVLDWLVGMDGQAVLARFGFLPPSS